MCMRTCVRARTCMCVHVCHLSLLMLTPYSVGKATGDLHVVYIHVCQLSLECTYMYVCVLVFVRFQW